MIAGTIWNQLVLTLEKNPKLGGYIKTVFEGRRYEIEPNSLPCLMIEPVSDGEVDKRTNNVQDVYLTVDIYAFSSNNFNDFPKVITGDFNYRGILDINNDIRACLFDSYQLGGIVIDVRPQVTEFDTVDTDKYPVRGLRIPVRILYRQQNGV